MTDTILFVTKPSLRRMCFFLILLVFGLALLRLVFDLSPTHPFVLVVVAVLLGLITARMIVTAFTRYELTKDHVKVRSGIVARKIIQINFDRITDTTAQQSAFQRMLGLATVYFNTAGSPTTEAQFWNITLADAQRFSAAWEYAREGVRGDASEPEGNNIVVDVPKRAL